MRRKMVWLGVPWMIWLFVAANCRTTMTLCLLLAILFLLGAFRLFQIVSTKQACFIAVSSILSVLYISCFTKIIYEPAIKMDQHITTFSGEVVSVTSYDNDMASYQVNGKFSDGTFAKILVYTNNNGADYGDQMQVAGMFTKIDSDYLWDSSKYYHAKGIFLETQPDAYVSHVHTDGRPVMRVFQKYREQISRRICALAGTDAGGMVSAMLLGTKDTISDELDEMLMQQGISHVISVSGLHLVIILFLLKFVFDKLYLHCWIQFVLFTVVIFCYAMMVCTPISIIRAGIMYLLMTSGRLFFRRADTFNSLCIAGVAITLCNPYCILDPSFLLSFTGTFGIGVFAPFMVRKLKKVKFPFVILVQFIEMCCVSVCTFPILILYFREISVISPLSNILLVPICSVMLALSLVIFLTGGIGWIAKPICFLLKLLYDAMYLLATGMRSIIPGTFPTGWELLPVITFLLVLFIVYQFLMKRTPRFIAIAISISLLIVNFGQFIWRTGEKEYFVVTALGMKHEMVILIHHANYTDCIDLTGHPKNPEYVKAYVSENGISVLNHVAITARALQMYSKYQKSFQWMPINEYIIPLNCQFSSNRTPINGKLTYSSEWKLEHEKYTLSYKEECLQISYGTYQILVVDQFEGIEIWDSKTNILICNQIQSRKEPTSVSVYQKEKPIQIKIAPNGICTIREIGKEKP